MKFRLANKSDVEEILNIIQEGQKFFKENGIDQWQNGYPNRETVLNDIDNVESYVLIDDENIIEGVCVISFREEITYNKIYDGEWIGGDIPYGVVHRIAVRSSLKKKGFGSIMFKEAERICRERKITSLRVDTHEDNKPMQGLVKKNGFTYCGVIYLRDGAKRIGFEKFV